MATYSYKVRMADGKIERGTLQAVSQSEALTKVKKIEGTLVELVAAKEVKVKGSRSGKISLKERIVLTEQLAVMLNAGITLVQSLKSLEEETQSKALKAVLGALVTDVQAGIQFSYALEKHSKTFSNIYVQMVRSAEKTGNLSDVLT